MRKKLAVPILIIIFGVTWLLNVKQIIPGVDWMWTVGLAVAGIFNLVFGGLNKGTVVTGPFLIVASVCSFLRQTNRLPLDNEIPVLIISLGVLMLISQLLPLPMYEESGTRDEEKK